MPDTVSDRHGVRVLLCAPDGPSLDGDADALDLIGQALAHHVDLVAVPVARLDERFFTLSTRIAGDIVQKFVNYRLRLAIVGDIAGHLSASSALRDFVGESNRGRQLWFVTDLDELGELLKARP